jgi:hypothetical protein
MNPSVSKPCGRYAVVAAAHSRLRAMWKMGSLASVKLGERRRE